MRVVNRAAITVTPKQPYIDWMHLRKTVDNFWTNRQLSPNRLNDTRKSLTRICLITPVNQAFRPYFPLIRIVNSLEGVYHLKHHEPDHLSSLSPW